MARLNNASGPDQQAPLPETYKYFLLLPTFLFFFSFPALFAYWLRSSVVSVLFSLISESFALQNNIDYPHFWIPRLGLCACACLVAQCHRAYTTPDRRERPFSSNGRLVRLLGEEVVFVSSSSLEYCTCQPAKFGTLDPSGGVLLVPDRSSRLGPPVACCPAGVLSLCFSLKSTSHLGVVYPCSLLTRTQLG